MDLRTGIINSKRIKNLLDGGDVESNEVCNIFDGVSDFWPPK